jgi:nucleoside-diphosphate-sugar epimerase
MTAPHRVLVTGATGFTGSHLVRSLLAAGNHVVGLDNQKGLFFDELAREGAELHLGSVTDGALCRRLAEGCESVFHLAAAFRQVNLTRAEYWRINVEGTRNVGEAALAVGARRLIYCSTCGVHGHVERTPSGEDAPIAPADYYQLTKYEGEKVVLELVKKGLGALILRPAAIYGPGDPERFLMIFRRCARGRFLMFGNGQAHYHPLYIDHLIDAFHLARASEKGDGTPYLIADAEYLRLDSLVAMVGKALGVETRIIHLPFWPLYVAALLCEGACKPFRISPPIFRRRADWFRQNRAFDISRARRELGYAPAVSFEEGAQRTAQWYRANRYL